MQDTLDLLFDNGYDLDYLEGTVIFNGFKDAIIGITDDARLVYDYDKIIHILSSRDKMTNDEAIEYADFNIVGFKLDNPRCPIIVYSLHT